MKPEGILNQGKQLSRAPVSTLQQGVALAAAVALPLLIGAAGRPRPGTLA